MNFRELLANALKEASIPFDETYLNYFEIYKNLLVEWNKSINLTAIEDEENIIYKHFIDSLMVLKVVDEFSSLLDIGSGAGFPGIPLKIAKRNSKLTLIESQKKKALFLEILLERLSLSDSVVYTTRAEELAKGDLREHFELVCEREFGKLPLNLEIGLPFVKIGGHLVLHKGEKDIRVLPNYEPFIEELGGSIESIFSYKLNDSLNRYLVKIKKEWHTPKRYPRSYSTLLREAKRWESITPTNN